MKENLILLIKLALLVGVLVMAYKYFATISSGQALRKTGVFGDPTRHKRSARSVIVVMWIVVVALEASLRCVNRPVAHGILFWIHLPCAAVFLGCLHLMYSRFNGQTAPSSHRTLAATSLVIFGAMLATGLALFVPLWS